MRTLQQFALDTAQVVNQLDAQHLLVLVIILKTTLITKGITSERGLVHVARELQARADADRERRPIHSEDCSLPSG